MIKLYIGCGKRNFGEDWIHIDGSNYGHIVFLLIFRFRYEENTIDIICLYVMY